MAHDFERDPIRLVERDGWVRSSKETTLGADNGIGVAMALALMRHPPTRHRALVLLFTVREEIGLEGARELDIRLLRDAVELVNLDAEGQFTIGCAGGQCDTVVFRRPCVSRTLGRLRQLNVQGGLGGHSGIQIHLGRTNAIQLLAELVEPCLASAPGIQLLHATGGSAVNVIPSSSEMTFLVPPDELADFDAAFQEAKAESLRRGVGCPVTIDMSEPATSQALAAPDALAAADVKSLIHLLRALPHGVLSMSTEFRGTVETSCNLATLTFPVRDDDIPVARRTIAARIGTSSRSFVDAKLADVRSRIASIATAQGAVAEAFPPYPGWSPNVDSELYWRAAEAFRDVRGQMLVVHAGLECGFILKKQPELAAISYGPEIKGAHTIEETVNMASVELVWKWLNVLIEAR